MKLRRGFKTEAERRSVQLRKELGLRAYDCLLARQLADYLGITIFAVNEIPGLTGSDVETICSGDVSAVAVIGCTPPLIIHNHLHAPTRQESDLMHEIAHCMLGHRSKCQEEKQSFFLHSYDPEQEEEAQWLGGCLQIPREGLVWALRQGMDVAAVASWFKASRQMVSYRRSITGVSRQLRR
ncbi:ImmA/IrrE family metallo-endopeptidase [Pontibacter chitinilyticus]|uniref:ImmA/IrrE family metallo-endopeptidase n=1 Tax=Pontibacter chitinilyticus TaxID=2674989 RepID=UPI003219D2D4